MCSRQALRLVKDRCPGCYKRLQRGQPGSVGTATPRIFDPHIESLCLPVPIASPGFATRVFSRIDFSGDCWEWTGEISNVGYGLVSYGSGRSRTTGHRAVWQLLVGQVADGLQLDHLCRNRICVNPDHLEPVTPRENVLRSYNTAAMHARREKCLYGHPYDATATDPRTGRSYRSCSTCSREKARRQYYAKKAAS